MTPLPVHSNPPSPVRLVLERAAQLRCGTEEELQRARRESRREIQALFLPLLRMGARIRRRCFSDGSLQVEESFQIDGASTTEIPSLLSALRYHRLVMATGSGQPTERSDRAPGIGIYRQVALVAVGEGVGRRRVTGAAGYRLLPLRRTLPRDEARCAYRVAVPRALPFLGEEMDRGCGVRTALCGAPGRWIEMTVAPLRPESAPRAYLERACALLGRSSDLREADPEEPLALDTYRALLAEDCCALVRLVASDVAVVQGFLRDCGATAFTGRPSPLGPAEYRELAAAGGDLARVIEGLAQVYSLEEGVRLLAPAITFHDALPGTLHFEPLSLPRAGSSSRPTVGSHLDGPRIALGRQEDGMEVMLPVESLRKGFFANGPMGAGKTTLMQTVVRGVRAAYPDLPIQVYDPAGFEYQQLMREEIGGPVIDFQSQPGGYLRFNPFLAPPKTDLEAYSLYLADFLATAFPTTALGRSYLAGMVKAVYREKYRRAHGTEPALLALRGRDQRADPAAVPTLDEFLGYGPQWLGRQGGSPHFQESLEFFRHQLELLRGSLLHYVLSGTQEIYPLFEGSFLLQLAWIPTETVQSTLLSLLLGLNLLYRRQPGDVPGEGPARMQALLCVEEAHRVMPKHPEGFAGRDVGPSAGENLAGLMGRTAREGRKFGIGLCLVGQSASGLGDDLLVNYANVIALRTRFGPDQEALGKTLGLLPAEQRALSALETGQAFARVEGMDRTILLRIHRR